MTRTFEMPELAESVVEGEIVAWLVQEGESVAEDQPLVEVMTDKVTVEIPSPFAGVLEKRLVAEGDVVPVGEPLARFVDVRAAADEGEVSAGGEPADAARASRADAGGGDEPRDASGSAAGPEDEPDDGASLTLFKAGPEAEEGPLPQVRKPAHAASVRAGRARGAGPATSSDPAAPSFEPSSAEDGPAKPRGPWGRPLAVPAARKLARQLGVPIEEIEGSGPHGRIRVHDVDGHAIRRQPLPASEASEAARPVYRGSSLRAVPDGPAETREPLRGLRRVIAQQMAASHRSAVRTLHVDEADVSRLVALRERLKGRAEGRGVSLSYLPFVMRALVNALAAFPMLNAALDEEADEIVRYRDVHLGLAVATDRGLVVPVIRDASRRTLLDLAAEARRLAAAARDGRLTGDEVRGGTFSVTNVGSIGGLFSFPIIHVPEAAILGVHSIKKRPVVLDDDTIAARPMLYLSLSFDHRLVDGAEAAHFTRHLIDLLEDPETLLLDA